ncbi:MAG: flagellar basal body L-ring protein FlgH [Planctomycetota bacterium]|nr:flagellar basal body L-ring protein FlgH [Planctomycetota bacterium]
MVVRCAWVVVTMSAVVGLAAGQSLLRAPSAPVATTANGQPDENAELKVASYFFIEPPKAKVFQKHDLITILVEENSRQSSKQALDAKKDYTLTEAIKQFPDLAQLLEARLQAGERNPIASLDLSSKNQFKGDGTYTRSDKFSAKITATVIDVKPNGTVVIEARKTIQNNEESQTIILSGTCRSEDVTSSNTVLSSQLADLQVISKTEGQVKDTATKGWIPRVLEAIFNF